ncbi:alpha-L-arabinofuranosidase C-terminal domain-containing protein [Pelagicoccus sp. SDUM812003]|uniref:alpha-N-arabinofuranosidase n=1 Tax=Pelagicoccus sp. SDUM812003 TaxID=3041267 RepID=UPI00280D9B40|nr:alpha-L-arabinofuranosidase C-terminal domain-containing protein [Pelagicoccus sp. SDUM812003]MDQ8202931.1 alpha-L-arabinofuranosidase C-terminal domain-containing protein [Pelagicoccus sp. SDUM812003]
MKYVLTPLIFAAASSLVVAEPVHELTIDAAGDNGHISEHIYGHFAEHLGRGIYDGFWKKDASGEYIIRDDVVAAMKELGVPNLRWPGGCFADYYFWEHGIGRKDQRPTVVNNLWGGVTEDNSVGTHEFMDLVAELEAEPIVVGNVGSGTVEDMANWWQYINHPGESPMAKLRRENGREDPWNVKYWGVGNESWGCGGHMRPEYYADLYRRFATFLHGYGDVKPFRIATGPAEADYNWTEVVMERAGHMIDGLDLHVYTIDGTWQTHKGQAVNFDESGWYRLMRRAMWMDELITNHKAIMDEHDPEKRVWLIVGEWGTWHEQEEGSTPGFLYQQNTLRDALTASVTLDIFHQHLDRVKMANIAQTINVLQAMILTDGEQMLLTPTYHVFDLYKPHREAKALPFELDRGEYMYEGEEGDPLPAISATASINDEGQVHISLTNIDPHQARTIEISMDGLKGKKVRWAKILTADEMNARNTFEAPEALVPEKFKGAKIKGGKLIVEMPAKSLVTLAL